MKRGPCTDAGPSAIPIERLVLELMDPGSERGDVVGRVNAVFSDLLERIRGELRDRFGDRSFIDDAALSACRTLLRRARDGELELALEGTLEDFLVSTAVARAWVILRGAMGRLVTEPADGHPSPFEEITRGEQEADRQELALAMRLHLETTLGRMAPYLENERHARVFRLLFREAYYGPPMGNAEVARAARCSERTVERVRQKFRERWLPLVEESRRDLREILTRLGEGGL